MQTGKRTELLGVKISPEMKAKLRAWADRENRKMSTQVIHVLSLNFPDDLQSSTVFQDRDE